MKYAVIALPRSRTAWLAHWLGASHEPLSRTDNLDDLPEGIVDTGSAIFFPALWKRWPKAHYLFVFRDQTDIVRACEKVGLPTEGLAMLRDKLLDAYTVVQTQENVLAVHFNRLSSLGALEAIWAHLKGAGFDRDRTEQLIRRNIQADLSALFDRMDAGRTQRFLKEQAHGLG
jgi:hypothetical protein